MGKYIYVSSRYMVCSEEECESLDGAIKQSLNALKYGEEWPVRILKNGETLWEQEGPFETEKSLIEFAHKNNIDVK